MNIDIALRAMVVTNAASKQEDLIARRWLCPVRENRSQFSEVVGYFHLHHAKQPQMGNSQGRDNLRLRSGLRHSGRISAALMTWPQRVTSERTYS